MGKYYVYSTMSQDVCYPQFSKPVGGGEYTPTVLRSVTIKGGTGVITKNLITPHGVVTQINDEEHAILKGGDGIEPSKVFEKHEKAGFVKIDKRKVKVENVVKDLQPKDLSAQKTDKDFRNHSGESAIHSVG